MRVACAIISQGAFRTEKIKTYVAGSGTLLKGLADVRLREAANDAVPDPLAGNRLGRRPHRPRIRTPRPYTPQGQRITIRPQCQCLCPLTQIGPRRTPYPQEAPRAFRHSAPLQRENPTEFGGWEWIGVLGG